jgi:hypothetical protein
MNPPAAPGLTLIASLDVDVGPVIDVGVTPAGRRRMVPILGGRVGGRLEGRIVPGGADYQIVEADGLIRLEARYVIELKRGGLVFVVNNGVRHGPRELIARQLAGEAVDPELIYFRTVARFETEVGDLQGLTRSIVVGKAERHPDRVAVHFFVVD